MFGQINFSLNRPVYTEVYSRGGGIKVGLRKNINKNRNKRKKRWTKITR